MKVKIRKLNSNAVIPKYGTTGAAAFDFVASEDVIIPPGETRLVKTGLAFEIPEGFELQVRPRSGLSLKTKLRVSNSPGTVDCDYRGEVCVIMENTNDFNTGLMAPIFFGNELHSPNAIQIKKGDRVAQGAICPVFQVEFDEVEDLSDTNRGSGGFGSTGTK